MSFTQYVRNFRRLLPVAAALLAVAVGQSNAFAQAVPAQKPLLSKTGIVVSPNLMVVLDDSGSMQFQHMPETVFAGGTYATTNPVGSNQVRIDPSDNYQTSFLQGTVPGNIASTNYILRALRSPDTNTIFYNPETRYQPWLNSDGVTRRINSVPSAAPVDPLNPTGTKTNLTVNQFNNASNSNWCYWQASNGSCTSKQNNTVTHDPGVYFRLEKKVSNAGAFSVNSKYTIKTVGTTNFVAIGALSNTVGVEFIATGAGTGNGTAVSETYESVTDYTKYTGYSINVGTSFTKYPNRADCTGATCTQTEERQNFANWYTYYRSRNLMARGSLMEVFGTTGNVFRLGFGRINKGTGQVDGSTSNEQTNVIESDTAKYPQGGGVRDFDQTRKNTFFKWLEDLPASGGTPLVAALDYAGKYYSRSDAKGPWTDLPGQSNSTSTNKDCRRSYSLMTTDGYWNGATASVGNADATAGSKISGTGGTVYTYSPTTPYQDTTSNTLADVAMYYWKRDLQTGMNNNVAPVADNVSFWQNMTTFTVGLGVRGTLDPTADLPALVAGTKTWPAATTSTLAPNVDDLWHAALNSRGAYFSAKDPTSLAAAVKGALSGVQGGSGSTAGVATASTVLENTNRKYIPTYKAGEWSGDINALPLDQDGQTTAAVWQAAARLPAWNSRKIFTWDPVPTASPSTPAGVGFDWSTISVANKTAMSSKSSVPSTYKSSFIDFLKGDHSLEGVSNPFRSRTSATGVQYILGDFINSNPVLIKSSFDGGYGSLGLGGANGYQNFVTAKAARDAVLFVGANDGMLHAFKDTKAATVASSATDGQEIFAYVPRAVYPNLYKLADKGYGGATAGLEHQYFVDGPQRESDAFVRGPGTTFGTKAATPSWRNYLTGSLGAGARAVYAIDVTNSPNLDASSIRWEISSTDDGDLGYVMAPLEVGVLPNGKWVAIFGNGFSSDNGYATLFVVDLETAAISKLNVDTSGANGLGGVAVVRDTNGQITNLYAGDLKGKLWKFDYSSSASAGFVVSGGSAFFTAANSSGGVQAITQAPGVFNHSKGGSIIVVGTGKLFETNDGLDTSTQTVYGVWDMPADPKLRPMTRSLLVPRTLASVSGTGAASGQTFYTLSGVSVDWVNERGWYIDLSPATTGGRVIYPVQPIGSKIALVSVVAPAQAAVVCQSSDGVGVDMTLDPEGGAAPGYPLYDTNGDNAYNSSDAQVVGYKTAADGINSVVYSPSKNNTDPNASDGVCGPGYYRVSIQTSVGQQMICVKRDALATVARIFNRVERRIINPPIR